MNARLAVIVAIVFSVGGLVAFSDWQRHQRQDAQMQAYAQHVQQLLGEVEASSRRRLAAEQQLDETARSLAELRSQLAAVNSQLQQAQQEIDPDYAALEQRIRQQVRRELQPQQPSTAGVSTVNLLRQLSQLDPLELGELMSLQTTFGPFLNALDVDDERLEVIVDGLSNMLAEQNQARNELIQQMQQDATRPGEMRQAMLEIGSPAAQAEALSFILTEDEMALFNEFQASQPQVRTFRRSFIGGTGDNTGQTDATFLIRTPGSGDAGVINLGVMPALPAC